MWFLSLLSFVVALVALMAEMAYNFKHCKALALLVCKALGFGFITYHSDSKKEFFSLTKRGALEWLAATYDDAILWKNSNKHTIAIYFGKLDRVEFY